MSTMSATVRRTGGDLDVFTGLLLAAFLVLLAGVVSLGMDNSTQVEGMSSENALFGVPGFEVIQD